MPENVKWVFVQYVGESFSNGFEEYPTTYEKVYGLGIYKKFFVTGYTPDMSCVDKYLEYNTGKSLNPNIEYDHISHLKVLNIVTIS